MLGPLQIEEIPEAECAQILSEMYPRLHPGCPSASPCHGSSGPGLEPAGLYPTPEGEAGFLACSSDPL